MAPEVGTAASEDIGASLPVEPRAVAGTDMMRRPVARHRPIEIELLALDQLHDNPPQ